VRTLISGATGMLFTRFPPPTGLIVIVNVKGFAPFTYAESSSRRKQSYEFREFMIGGKQTRR